MALPLSHADFADQNGPIASIGALPLARGGKRLAALRRYGMRLRGLGSRAVPAAATLALMAAGYNAEQISVLHMTFDAFRGGIVVPGHKGAK